MGQKIERDHQRSARSSAARSRATCRKYISRGEMIGKKGPRSRQHPAAADRQCRSSATAARARAASARATAKSAQPIGQLGRRRGGRPATSRAGTSSKSSLTLEEMAADPWRGTGPAAHRAQGQEEHRRRQGQIHRHPPGRAGIAAALQADLQAGAKRQISSNIYDPDRSARRADPRGQAIPLAGRTSPSPTANAVHHLHDGRVRLDDRRAERDRPHRGVLDRHLAQEPVHGRRERATSSTTPWPRRWTSTPSTTPARAAARKISSAYKLANKIIDASYPPTSGTSTAFHFSDGDNWGDDNPHCIQLLHENLLPKRQPVRLRPGRKPVRQRRVLRIRHELLGET